MIVGGIVCWHRRDRWRVRDHPVLFECS